MFIQGSNAELDISVSIQEENIIPLDSATVFVYFQRRDYKFNKEAIVTDVANGKAVCYLTAADLLYDGNYDYQVVLKYSNGNVVKSCINSFYVYPALDATVATSTTTTGDDING